MPFYLSDLEHKMQVVLPIWVLYHSSSSSFSAPSPSLLVSPSPPSASFTHKTSESAHTAAGGNGRHNRARFGSWCWNFFCLIAAAQVDLWGACVRTSFDRVCSHELNVSPGFNVAHGGLRRSVFHVKVGLWNRWSSRETRATSWFLLRFCSCFTIRQSARPFVEIFSIWTGGLKKKNKLLKIIHLLFVENCN